MATFMLETVVSDVSTVVAVADNFADAPDSNRSTGRNLPSVFRKLGKVTNGKVDYWT